MTIQIFSEQYFPVVLFILSDIKHGNQKSNIEHQTSDIEFKTSDMGHQTSDIGHRTSNIMHRTSAKRHQLSDIEDQRETRNFTKNVRTFLPPSNFVDFDGLQGDGNCTKLSNKPTLLTFEQI